MTPLVQQTIASLERFIATVDDAMALPREAGAMLHAMILATGATRGLEIGTSYGYSTLWIGSALAENGGTLITIDRDPRKSAAAKATIAKAGLDGCVEFRTGEAADVIASLSEPFDFILNDADKEHCIRYLELLSDKLSERAAVVTDNIKTHAAELATFLDWVRNHKGYRSIEVPIGNGLEVSVRRVKA